MPLRVATSSIPVKTKPPKKSKRSTSKRVAVQLRQQSVTRTRPRAETPKESQARLKPWLVLANLLPAPPTTEVRKRSPLLIALERLGAEPGAESPADLVRRFERSAVSRAPAITVSLDLSLMKTDEDQAERFLQLARQIVSTLSTLVTAASLDVLEDTGGTPILVNRVYKTPATSRSEIWIKEGRVDTRWVDPYKDFLSALAGVEAERVRQCAECKSFFFALRKDRRTCSKRCNSARRVRNWSANQAEHEYRRKLRKAGIETGKRRKRFTK